MDTDIIDGRTSAFRVGALPIGIQACPVIVEGGHGRQSYQVGTNMQQVRRTNSPIYLKGTPGMISRMISEIRRANLQVILDQDFGGSKSKLAELLGIESSYISRFFSSSKQHRRNIGSKFARKIEAVTGRPVGWMDRVHNVSGSHLQYGTPISNLPVPNISQVAVLSWSQAAKEDRLQGESIMGIVPVPFSVGPNGFALEVIGDAMAPDYMSGGFIVIDPDIKVRSGQVVIALPKGGNQPLLRRYIVEGEEELLVPINPQYPTHKSGEVIGFVVGYYRPNSP